MRIFNFLSILLQKFLNSFPSNLFKSCPDVDLHSSSSLHQSKEELQQEFKRNVQAAIINAISSKLKAFKEYIIHCSKMIKNSIRHLYFPGKER